MGTYEEIENLFDIIMNERYQYAKEIVILRDRIKDLEEEIDNDKLFKISNNIFYIVKDHNNNVVAYYKNYLKAKELINQCNNGLDALAKNNKEYSNARRCSLSLEITSFSD